MTDKAETDVNGLIAELQRSAQKRIHSTTTQELLKSAANMLKSLSSPAMEDDVARTRLVAFVASLEGVNWVPDGCPISTRPEIDDRRLTVGDLRALASPAPAVRQTISPTDPSVIIAGIRQFGLAADGSDLRDLEAAIGRLSCPSPPGWQLVPKYPTDEMIQTARRTYQDHGPRTGQLWGSEAAEIYRAMLAAAPSPQTEGGER